ncbi:NAD(P)/FAD-dependent oxidoreductase [Sphingomonas flavalba]|uniref:NAD(P)/FAD-dependent oxidoreductase n=1 Tax=Sphingomonas flavalba TaxID=2559804 RepID=UPI0039E1A227
MRDGNQGAPASAIVIGGGVVGLCCALELQRRGIATTIVAPADSSDAASWGNAGHVAIEQVEPLASPATLRSFPRRLFWRGGPVSLPPGQIGAWLPFALRLLGSSGAARFAHGKAALTELLAPALPAWRRVLADAGAADVLVEDGHFVVWESPATAAAGRAHWMAADTGETTVRDATAAELAAIAALVRTPPVAGIRFAGSGQIADLPTLAGALRARFLALGGVWQAGLAIGLAVVDGKAMLTRDDGSRMTADAVLVAAGAASGALMSGVGARVPIIHERGYHIQTTQGHWPASMPPVVFEDRAVIVTGFRSGLRAASFVEFGGPNARPDPRKWARLARHAEAIGLPFDAEHSRWTGARPTLPDYLPAIGRSPAADNLFYAFGHQHLGLTLAAVTGELMGGLISGVAPTVALAPFDLARFGR